MTLLQLNLQLARAFDVISMTCLMLFKGYLHVFQKQEVLFDGAIKGKSCSVFVKWPVCGWTLSFSVPPSREIWRCVCAAGWRGRRMVFMVQLRRDIFKMLHANLFLPVCLPSSLSFSILKCHILYLPLLPSPLILSFCIRLHLKMLIYMALNMHIAN